MSLREEETRTQTHTEGRPGEGAGRWAHTPRTEASGGTSPADTLNLDFQPPGPGEKPAVCGTVCGSEHTTPGGPSEAGRSALVLASPHVFHPEQHPSRSLLHPPRCWRSLSDSTEIPYIRVACDLRESHGDSRVSPKSAVTQGLWLWRKDQRPLPPLFVLG